MVLTTEALAVDKPELNAVAAPGHGWHGGMGGMGGTGGMGGMMQLPDIEEEKSSLPKTRQTAFFMLSTFSDDDGQKESHQSEYIHPSSNCTLKRICSLPASHKRKQNLH